MLEKFKLMTLKGEKSLKISSSLVPTSRSHFNAFEFSSERKIFREFSPAACDVTLKMDIALHASDFFPDVSESLETLSDY